MKYGHARVSADDQRPALQLAALKRAGCKTLFKDEGLSGATTKRPALLQFDRNSAWRLAASSRHCKPAKKHPMPQKWKDEETGSERDEIKFRHAAQRAKDFDGSLLRR